METESENSLPFLTGRYLHFSSNHPPHMKRGVMHSLINRARTICKEKHEFSKQVMNIRRDLALNGYPRCFIDSFIKKTWVKSRPLTDGTRLGSVVIPYKGISEKFRCIGERYNIKAVLKTIQTLRSVLIWTRPHREVQDMRHASTVFLVNVVSVT
jgi:hypothetical protein